MEPLPVGTRVRVIANTNSHNYRVGGMYVIKHVDPNDSTYRLADESGRPCGNWIRWSDVRGGMSDWSKIAASLPDDLVAFLSAFDGIADIRLREAVVDTVLESLPNLNERILAVAMTGEGKALLAANRPIPLAPPQA